MASSHPIKTMKLPDFRNLMFGRFLMVLSFRMLSTLLGWWVYQMTKDPLAIGLIGLSEVVPAVGSALYAGHVIDNSEKKKLLLMCVYSYLILMIVLACIAYSEDVVHRINSSVAVNIIYGVIFLTGFCRAFIGPIVPAMIPKIVGKEILASAITVNQAFFLIASVFGHAIGGFFIHWFGIFGTLNAIIIQMFLGSLFFWSVPKHFPEQREKVLKIKESIKEGIEYIIKTKEILGALLLDMFAVLFGGAVAMIPVYATDILHVGSEGFGFLNAATDIGSMCVIISLTFFPLKKKQGKILLFAVAGFGLCIIGFGLSHWYWVSFGFLMLSGMLDGISVVIRGTIVQLKTPEHIRGRVLSVNSMFIMSSNELGQFESGVMARLLGTVRSVVFGGCMTVLIALYVGKNFKKLRNMEY